MLHYHQVPSSSLFIRFFTLIELLVVVAIIAILAGMLLPALSSARDRARSINCTGNLKSINHYLQEYSATFDDFTPSVKSWDTATSRDRSWWNLIQGYAVPGYYSNPWGFGDSKAPNTKILLCPSDITVGYIGNYGYNGNALFPLDDKTKFRGADVRKIGRLKFPTRLMWVGEGRKAVNSDQRNAYGVINQSLETKLERMKHSGSKSGNFGMVDGHVENISLARLEMELGQGDLSFFFDNRQIY